MQLIKWDDPDIEKEEIDAVSMSLRSSLGSKAQEIKYLEAEFKNQIGCKHAILVSNGTTALFTALNAIKFYNNVKKIDVPSFTFIASASMAKFAIENVNLIDCSPASWIPEVKNLSEDSDIVMTVDVGGVSCDYDKLKKSGKIILADSAESLGTKYKGKPIGTQADIHCFSFQNSKIITCGEGGLITTNNDDYASFCRSFINHGYSENKKEFDYVHDIAGFNFRMCGTEASILAVQLKKLPKYLVRRQEIGQFFDNQLSAKFKVQRIPSFCSTNRFFYAILINPNSREKMVEHLNKKNIKVKCWKACHKQKPFLLEDSLLPESSKISDSNILLPIHNKLTDAEVEHIANSCLNF